MSAVVALILRTIDADLYHRFVRGAASDLKVVDRMFDHPEVTHLQREEAGLWFEATIIKAGGGGE